MNMYEILMRPIRNVTVRGGGEDRCYKYLQTYTLHINNPSF